MSLPSLRSLLEVGAHVGHRKAFSHPAARRFTYTVKDGMLVINLEKTIECMEAAVKFMKKTIEDGGVILFVGTKPQARESLQAFARALNQPFVSSRWLGGTLTNFDTVKKSLFQLQDLEKTINDPAFEQKKKRERLSIKEKHAKLTRVFEGMLTLSKAPDAMFIVDPAYEDIAAAEAGSLKIPVIAVMDTNASPEPIAYPIPINDESKRAVTLVLEALTDELKDVKVKAAPSSDGVNSQSANPVKAEKAAPKKEKKLPVAKKAAPKSKPAKVKKAKK